MNENIKNAKISYGLEGLYIWQKVLMLKLAMAFMTNLHNYTLYIYTLYTYSKILFQFITYVFEK